MKDYNRKFIEGVWFNDEVEYTFKGNSVVFQDLKRNEEYTGVYRLEYNRLELIYEHESNPHLYSWEAVIERIDDGTLIYVDLSNQIGRREEFRKRAVPIVEEKIEYTRGESYLSILSFLVIAVCILAVITDVRILNNTIIDAIITITILPSVFYIRRSYRKIDWVKEVCDDLFKLFKDIVGNGAVQKALILAVLSGILLSMIYLIHGILLVAIK